jgi:hypothetical protein
MKDRFCKELEHVFDKVHKNHMIILLGYFNAKRGRVDRLCGLVVRVPGYIFRSPGFDSWRYQIF